MNVQFRLPPLTAGSEKEQLRQLSGYLRQTVEQLNWAMGQLSAQPPVRSQPAAQTTQTADDLAAYAAVKALIIQSADVVQTFAEKTRELLRQSGEYVAQSQFGTYREALEQRVTAQADGIEQRFSQVEAITGSIRDSLRKQNSYLRFGLVGTTLDAAAATDAPGIEIGDFRFSDENSQVALRQRFARFTAYGLELFGSDNQRPVAYISDRQLHIEAAQIRQLQMGNFLTAVRPDGSTVKRWIKNATQEGS